MDLADPKEQEKRELTRIFLEQDECSSADASDTFRRDSYKYETDPDFDDYLFEDFGQGVLALISRHQKGPLSLEHLSMKVVLAYDIYKK